MKLAVLVLLLGFVTVLFLLAPQTQRVAALSGIAAVLTAIAAVISASSGKDDKDGP